MLHAHYRRIYPLYTNWSKPLVLVGRPMTGKTMYAREHVADVELWSDCPQDFINICVEFQRGGFPLIYEAQTLPREFTDLIRNNMITVINTNITALYTVDYVGR